MIRAPAQVAVGLLVLAAVLGVWQIPESRGSVQVAGRDPAPPAAFNKATPESLEDLRAMQEHVRAVTKKVMPAVVNVRLGMGQGSGVIITEDGYVLTAGHVSGAPGRDVWLTLADGRRVKGKTLGVNRGIDSGLIKITEQGKWPHVEMGTSKDVKKGQWCLAIGHPTGLRPGRAPVVRLGRVLDFGEVLIRTDCALVGGDDGGPLFDMNGKVIGIHSRFAVPMAANIHVPVDTYRETWAKLKAGEAWGGGVFGQPTRRNEPYIGVTSDPDGEGCKILEIAPGSPAEKAGLKANDVVLRFDGQKIADFDSLRSQVLKRKPGQEVTVEVRRGEAIVSLKLVVGKRPGRMSDENPK
jgi:serine protease Do